MLRRLSTLRLVENTFFPPIQVNTAPSKECIMIQVDHDLKHAHMNSTMHEYYEQNVVVPRLEKTLRDLYPNYGISVYEPKYPPR